MNHKARIAVTISHPIQHFCPQYESWAKLKGVELRVFFASTLGFKKYYDVNFQKEVNWGNIRLDMFDHVFLNGGTLLPSDSKLDEPSIESELTSFSPDMLITYGYSHPFQRKAHHWARNHKVKLAYISDGELRQKRSIFKDVLKYPMLYRYFAPIDYFLTVGDANEAFYRHYGVPDSKLVRMHFPIDVASYREAYRRRDELGNAIRVKHSIGHNEFVASVVGKLVSWKSQDHIIEAMLMLERQGIYLHLFVLGSGELMEPWKAKANLLTKSKVHFPGFVNIEELPSYYAASNVYVHPAAKEPHSLAISEAIFMGCPVIISDRCGSYGPGDDVQEGKNGFVYTFGKIDQLAAKIAVLKGDQKSQVAFSEYSHQIAVDFQRIAHGGILSKIAINGKERNPTRSVA